MRRQNLRVVGKPLPRVDAGDKVTGKSVFVADVSLPGMLHAKLVRCPDSHARIVRIDLSRAEKLPGVKATITGKDLPTRRDCSTMAVEVVRYAGQPVAAVAADDPRIAEEAARLVRVEYEVLPAVVDPMEALKPGAPVVWPDGKRQKDHRGELLPPNVTGYSHFVHGDVERGFKESDFIFEDTFVTQTVHQGYLETHGYIAEADRATGKITLWTSTQSQFNLRGALLGMFRLAASRLRVVGLSIGGGFGGKSEVTMEPVCIVLAQKTGRPVKLILTREEDMTACTARGKQVIELKTGVKKDGRLVARRARIVGDGGAYGYASLMTVLVHGPYRIPNQESEGLNVATHTVAAGAHRAPGAPQALFACESQMDIIAGKLGMDAVEIRRKNLVNEGDFVAGALKMPRNGWRKALEEAADKSGWAQRKRRRNRGMGIACGPWDGATNISSAYVILDSDGTASVISGAVDVSGTDTSFAQITAETLGIRMEDVTVSLGDTDSTPYVDGSWGSRVTYAMGTVVKRAAEQVRKQVLGLAAKQLGEKAEDLEIVEGTIKSRKRPGKKMQLRELAQQALWEGGPLTGQASLSSLPSQPALAVQVAEVEVDRETGAVAVLKLTNAQDVGYAINPMSVEGQMEGAALTGMGYGLMEEYVYEEGPAAGWRLLNPSFLDYRLPTSLDMPEIESVIVEEPTDTGPFGVKGVGEPPVIPTAAAIANAIEDAVGVRIKELPITRERVLRAMQDAERDG